MRYFTHKTIGTSFHESKKPLALNAATGVFFETSSLFLNLRTSDPGLNCALLDI